MGVSELIIKLPVRNGAWPNHSRIYNGIKTLPFYLQSLGYNTAIIGKRHYAPAASYPVIFLGGREHDDGSGTDVDLNKAEEYVMKHKDNPFWQEMYGSGVMNGMKLIIIKHWKMLYQ